MNHQTRAQVIAGVSRLTESLKNALDSLQQIVIALFNAWFERSDAQIGATPATTESGEKLLTIKQIGEYLQVCEATIRKRIKNDGFPSRSVGDEDLRFDLAEVNEWTKRHRKSPCTNLDARDKVTQLRTRLQPEPRSKTDVSL